MYKIIITSLLIIVLQLKAVTDGNCQTKAINDNQKYTLEILPLKEDNLRLIKFNLESECSVKIKITDHVTKEEQFLVDDEMQAGEYNVYYKIPVNALVRDYTCIMEISGDKNAIMFSKVISMASNKFEY